MITGLKPYPAMRDSGVEWLGEVPEHWEVRRLKYLLRERDKRSADGSEQLLRVSQYTGITERRAIDGTDEPDTRAASLIGYKSVNPSELVVNIMLAWNGSMGVSSFLGICSPAYCVYRFNNQAVPWYYHNLLRSPVYKARIKAVSTGVIESRLRLYTDDLYCLEGLLPPLTEQAAIARYLDHVDRLVRRLVRVKRKLIVLLTEQKQAIIHRAVTRGLDPDVPLKDSGVEWIGEVPENWEVVTLRRVILSAIDGPHHSPTYVDEGIPFLSARNIKADRWSLADTKYISEADYAEFSRRVVPEPGDVLYTKGGTTGIARAVDLDFRFQVWVHVAVLKVVKRKILPEFLSFTLNSPRCYEQSQLFTRGATNQDLGLNRMKGIYLALPPKAEQAKILAHFKKELLTTRNAIARATREIELLDEYRTRLIVDVVTGKLDVRAAAAALPETDPLDPGTEVVVGDLDAIVEEAEA